MSLYLPEQKLGSHSAEGGSSQKFILKGRQAGGMHRGHTWVFRAETHDTMMAWYEDIKTLTEKTLKERNDFVRGHSRSVSRSSRHSMSSDGGVVDEDDDEPFSASSQVDVSAAAKQEVAARRPQPGGRFPSDLQVNAQRGLQAPISPSSVSSGRLGGHDYEAAMASGGLQDGGGYASTRNEPLGYGSPTRMPLDETPSRAAITADEARKSGLNQYTSEPLRPVSASHVYGTGVTNIRSSVSSSRPQSVPEQGNHGNGSMVENDSLRGPPAKQGDEMKFLPMPEQGPEVEGANGDFPSPSGIAAEPGRKPSNLFDGIVQLEDDRDPRPTKGTVRNDSVPTLANLHIPGQYPKTPRNGTQT